MDPQHNPQNPPSAPTPELGQASSPQVVMPQWTYQSGQLQQQQVIGDAVQQSVVQNAEQPKPASMQEVDEDALVSWSASEFLVHEKTRGWYTLLGGGTLLLAIIVGAFTRDLIAVTSIVILGAAVAVIARLKPRELTYTLYPDGIQVGEKYYSYIDFRSFSLLEGPVPSMQLLPQKRIMVPITVYFAPEDADKIIETIGDFLPFEQRNRDWVDRFTNKIRF